MHRVYTRKSGIDQIDYNGPRTAKGLTEFAKQNMENLVVRVTDENLSSFFQNNVSPVKDFN